MLVSPGPSSCLGPNPLADEQVVEVLVLRKVLKGRGIRRKILGRLKIWRVQSIMNVGLLRRKQGCLEVINKSDFLEC